MNEKIKELAEQAEVWNADGDKCEVDLEKFVELIVRETLQVARAGIEYGPSMDEAVYTYFGIEE